MNATLARFLYIQIALVLAVGACATSARLDTANTHPRNVQFDCEGTGLTVRFETGKAQLTWRDGQDTLDQKPAASGIWYESSHNSLRGKAQDVTWTRDGHGAKNCRELR
jgi:membrane-bound inhibitor of C-type lysozyme